MNITAKIFLLQDKYRQVNELSLNNVYVYNLFTIILEGNIIIIVKSTLDTVKSIVCG